MRRIFASIIILSVFSAASFAQETDLGSAIRKSKNKFNPEVSVIGWLQAETGRRNPASVASEEPVFHFKEAELSLQSNVDAYGRAEFFIGFDGEEGVELEEGYFDFTSLPYNLGLKAGKFRNNFGKFNRTHVPETSFADRPLVHEQFFGDEGLSAPGVSLSWQIPNPWLFAEITTEVVNNPDADEVPAFGKARKRELLYVNRLSGYHDITEALNITLGGSYANGAAGQELIAVPVSSRTLKSELAGFDLTLRWKDPRKANYRSALWQTEALWSKRDAENESHIGSWGMFSHLQYQFARRWKTGFRYDYTQLPTDGTMHEAGGLAYLTFMPSEFSLISLQGRRARRFDQKKETLGWLKVTFNIGPHGSHPF